MVKIKTSRFTGHIEWYSPLFFNVTRVETHQISHGNSDNHLPWEEDKDYNVSEKYI
jgi:hypothetical protein